MNVVDYKNIKIYRNFKNPRTEIDIDKQQFLGDLPILKTLQYKVRTAIECVVFFIKTLLSFLVRAN
jgi:hypothetical protein